MPEPEATPEFQATAADLSPFSPSPQYSANQAQAVVPALQDTADILDAMSAETNGSAEAGVVLPPATTAAAAAEPHTVGGPDGANDRDDAQSLDSLDDAYGEEEEQETHNSEAREQREEPDAGEDDYLKFFDSPPPQGEEDDGAEHEEDHVSKARESHYNSAASDSLTSPSHVGPSPVASAAAAASADSSSARPAPADQPSISTEPAPTTAAAQPGAVSAATNTATSNGHPDNTSEDEHAVDISRLVAEMTGQTSEVNTNYSPAASTQSHDVQPSSNLTSSASATLPPRPPMPQQTASPHTSEDYRGFHLQNAPPQVSSMMIAPPTPGQPSTYVAAGAPGTAPDTFGSLPPPPATGLNAPIPITSMNAPPYPNPAGFPANQSNDTADHQTAWDTFIADERRYMADGKWDKFPDGSRIFIGSRSLSSGRPDGAIDFFSGNLSSERVSKRDVFDIFSKHGRLAQISLKSAYGFVQYYNLEDAQSAMDNLQGIEIKGRKIHLEVSRAQKKKDGNERKNSPDRGRGARQSGRQDRHDSGHQNHDNRRSRDDYRPGRNSPPRRSGGHTREDSHGRDRNRQDSHDRSRGRSRSPQGYGRQHDGYRRRSPSPRKAYGRGPTSEDRLDIPRRYGSQVPDVQFLLLQELSRDFVGWVERAFTDRGLKVDVMFLHPSFPRDAIVQRQVVEGVHAIIDLDIHAQNYGKIPVRLFDRTDGVSARYEDYRDVDPPIAAELVLRNKSKAPPPYQAVPPSQAPYQAAPPPQAPYQGYGQPYGGQPAPAHVPVYPSGQGLRGPPPAQQPALNNADLANLLKGIDNATLQQFLATMSAQGAGSAAANLTAGAANAQIQAAIGNHQATPPAPLTQPVSYGGQVFAPNGAPTNAHPAAAGTGESDAQVKNIMAQLARYRQ
ncbi:putative RNA-binding protein C3H8.09c [Colletotrichum chlorophyti]|uniref:Putative RNA-binding protein C3H8.09c n=1 Tax=Colletotrichum chlorophyti TaxID=708187 RepID=A0A1Q8S157_9PEZI|nr:putative RNA-binding protein C3H8.09c [Colletotrichum chlorophyti]